MRALTRSSLFVFLLALACGPETGERSEHNRPDPGTSIQESPYLVSLSPVGSRFLLAIGAGERILGVDARSQKLPGLEDRPIVTLQNAFLLGPDLILTAESPENQATSESFEIPTATRVVEFAPHDLEEVLELARRVGEPAVGRQRANRFEIELSRPLAQIGGESFGQPRPRAAAVVHLDPVTLAGGHSFETDLIEIAGGNSVTHGNEATRIVVDAEDWPGLAPDLVVVMTPRAMSESERNTALDLLPGEYETVFFPFLPESFWLDTPVKTARRFRSLIAERARRLDSSR